MRSQIFHKISQLYSSNKLIWIFISLGIILRLVQYLSNRSLWVDESMLSLNIIDRSFSGLLQPLDYNQGAPIGFLILEKLCVEIFNNSEYSLRLFPFLTGVFSLFLFYRVATIFIQSKAIPIALSLFAISGPLIYYSSEVKQYSSDVFISLLIYYYAGIVIQSKHLGATVTIFFGVLGATAIWFSHPSVFTLAGVGISLTIFFLIKKEWAKIAQLSITYLLWALSFIGFYFISLRNLSNNDSLLNFFSGAFMPFPPCSFSDIKWFYKQFFELFKTPLGFTMVGIASLTFLLGTIQKYHKDKEKFLILILPAFFALLASGFRLYPFKGRLLLFIVPSFLLFIGEGSEYIREKTTKNDSFIIGIAILCLLFLSSISFTFSTQFPKEEIKPVINYIIEHKESADKLYLYYGSIPAYRYYLKRFLINKNDYIDGRSGRENWKNYIDDINKLRSNKRVWILFSHVWTTKGLDEEKFILNYLNTVGTKLDEFKSYGASVYLYDLDK